MKTKIISVFICMLMCVTVFSVTGTEISDRNPINLTGAKISENPTDDPWDLLFSIDVGAQVGAAGRSGGEFDGTYFYTTAWASNLIDKFDIYGTYIETFSIAGVSGLRDLAYDGTYMYGGAAGGTIWEMDFDTATLVSSITGGFQSRAIAYDSDQDVFYCSNWGDPVWVVERTGAIPETINLVTTTSTYGFAYDTVSEGSPYLWVWDQGSGGGFPQYIHQYDLVDGAFTGFTYDVSYDVGSGEGIAGALWLTTEYDTDIAVIGGVYQDGDSVLATDFIFGYELCELGPPVYSDLDCSGELSFTDVTPGDTVTGTFTVENIGDEGSELSWEIQSYPDWGTWTFDPDGGTGLIAGDSLDVDVEIVAPDETEAEFDGEIVLVNSEDGGDTCTILVSLVTPVSHSVTFLELLAQRFPIFAKILALVF
jgi:hypothetical protein